MSRLNSKKSWLFFYVVNTFFAHCFAPYFCRFSRKNFFMNFFLEISHYYCIFFIFLIFLCWKKLFSKPQKMSISSRYFFFKNIVFFSENYKKEFIIFPAKGLARNSWKMFRKFWKFFKNKFFWRFCLEKEKFEEKCEKTWKKLFFFSPGVRWIMWKFLWKFTFFWIFSKVQNFLQKQL